MHLASLEVDWEVIGTLRSRISKDVSIAKCFLRLKNLQLDLFYDADHLSRGWDVILLALQTLEKLKLKVECFGFGRFHLVCALWLLLTHDKLNHKTYRIVSLFNLIWVGSQPCDISKLNRTVTDCWYPNNQALFRFLTCLLSIPSSPSGIGPGD